MVNQKNKAYVIIMAQQQHVADVHPDELCPPNKRYDLIDANKKVDLEHVQCPSKSKILTNIIKNHPLRFSIAASSFVPWIYMAQTIFHLSTELTTIKNSFMPPPSFSDMVLFYKQVLGFTMELKTSSSFKTSGLLQPWQTLCKIFSKCLTTRVTGWDQPPLQIMQMMYCFVNNIHVDYTSTIGRMYLFPQYQHFDSISKIYKDHYVPLTQSQPTESTQGKHRTPSAPRSPNPNKEAAESSDPRRSTMIRLLQSKNDESNIRGTRIEPRSNKESPEVEITKDKEVEITKDKEVEITKETPVVDITNVGRYGYLFTHLRARFMPRKSFDTLADNLHDVMVETLPTMVDKHIKEQVMKQVMKQVSEEVHNQVPVYVAEGLILEMKKAKEEMERWIAKAIWQNMEIYYC
ncbi:hypothetical protein Tco_0352729 [Tanacetum coccineum]